MAGLNDLIPGLKEAGDAYRAQQIDAFLTIPHDVGGVDLVPLTPRIWIDLHAARNGYVNPLDDSGNVSIYDALQFLWRCSVKYSPTNSKLRTQFNILCRPLVFVDINRAILSYITDSFSAKPLEDDGPKKENYASWPAVLVDVLASEYGWTEEYILNLPFSRLFQYWHRINARNDKDYRQMPPEVVRKRIEFLNAENAKNGTHHN